MHVGDGLDRAALRAAVSDLGASCVVVAGSNARVRLHAHVADPQQLFAIVRAGFGQRRKMLRQSLRPVLGADAAATIEAAGIDPRARAETLDLDAWAALARTVAERAA